MTVPFVKYGATYTPEIREAIERTITTGQIILRQEVEDFEKKLAEFVGTKYAVGLNSGTDALFLSLKYLGIGEGDEVITVGHTFHATVEAIVHCGATPVLVDVGEDGQMDISKLPAALTPRTKAIIPVHLMGDMSDMKYITEFASYHDLLVIEDACQALGSERDGKKAGAWGKTGCFSFYPAKILGAYGDAGAITTNDEALYTELKQMRNHYKDNPGKYGWNSRLDNLQAAILNVKMGYLPQYLERRQEIAEMYDQGINPGDADFFYPTVRDGRVYQDYIIETDKRDELYAFLKERGVETMKNDYHFPDDCPKPEATVWLESRTLRLPCNPETSDAEVQYVIEKVNEFYGTNIL